MEWQEWIAKDLAVLQNFWDWLDGQEQVVMTAPLRAKLGEREMAVAEAVGAKKILDLLREASRIREREERAYVDYQQQMRGR